ncbi:MAG: adenosine kinase, partial [Deltaproteobacteria bacterium]|nr:adenosine kinase [Deltaproteobacteria bacterium]
MSTNDKKPLGGKLVTGLGSALVDILIHESDDFVSETGVAKGGMDLVEEEVIREILLKSKAKPTIVPGGSACNT